MNNLSKNLSKNDELKRPFDKPKVVKEPEIERGTLINIRGVLYKTIAVRPNGKITLKPIKIIKT